MKLRFLIFALLLACSKQDFENDITIPKVLKDYHNEVSIQAK
jgi:hypothetical protein